MGSMMITKHTHTYDHVYAHTAQLVAEQQSTLVTQARVTAAYSTTQTSHHYLSTPLYVQHLYITQTHITLLQQHTYIHVQIKSSTD